MQDSDEYSDHFAHYGHTRKLIYFGNKVLFYLY